MVICFLDLCVCGQKDYAWNCEWDDCSGKFCGMEEECQPRYGTVTCINELDLRKPRGQLDTAY
jgi:hypothetical protein